MQKKLRKYVVVSSIIAIAIVLNILESFVPMPFSMKIGLANIATLFTLYVYSSKDALLVTVFRVVLANLLRPFGFDLNVFLMSLSGGLLALTVMVLFKKLLPFGIIVISVMGAIGHVVGQFIVGIWLFNSIHVLTVIPLFLVIALPSGILIGFITKTCITNIKLFLSQQKEKK